MWRLIAETDTVVHDGPDAQRPGTCRIFLYLGVVRVVENEMVAVVSPGAKRAFWEGFVTFSLAGLAGFTSHAGGWFDGLILATLSTLTGLMDTLQVGG